MDAVFAESARGLVRGSMSFGEFAEATRGWTRRQAVGMVRRLGEVPTWLGLEDLEQEIRIELWKAQTKYDPCRGRHAQAEVFMSFCARKSVQKRVQKAQGLEQHRRSGPKRFERACEHADLELISEPMGAEEEEAVARAEHYAVLRGLCETRTDLKVIEALERSGGGLESSASELWADSDVRFECRLLSERHAARVVRQTVEKMVSKFGVGVGLKAREAA